MQHLKFKILGQFDLGVAYISCENLRNSGVN